MLYYLFEYLKRIDFPGSNLFNFLSFRSGVSFVIGLIFSLIVGKYLIKKLRKLQIGETIRDLGLEGEQTKSGTPTMGGLIIILGTLIPALLFGKLFNTYLILMLATTVWLGLIGFLDDYIKVFKKNKDGLHGKFKIVGQIGIGLIVGFTLYFSEQTVVRVTERTIDLEQGVVRYDKKDVKTTSTSLPFIKNNTVDYKDFLSIFGDKAQEWAWVLFIIVTVFIITAVSNGSNLTDGIDGLASGVSAIIGVVLIVLAYVSGSAIYAHYLGIMHLPNSGEIVVFLSGFIGALVGFLWYNSYPAQIFMGDTGSLTIGGIIAVTAIILKKELLIPLLCGIFFIESLSVILQVGFFKYSKRKYGIGKRIFRMAPLHHHYQKGGIPEAKITTRFYIVSLILAVLTLLTLKIR